MVNLILKDILIQKKSFILVIILSFLLLITSKRHLEGIYPFIAVFTVYAFVATSFYKDEKIEIMLNSLPVNKVTIVISRYLSTFIFVITNIIILSLIAILVKYIGILYLPNVINIESILVSLIITIFLVCILLPIYFKYGYFSTRYITIVLLVSIFFIFISLPKISGEKVQYMYIYLNSIPETIMKSIILLLCCIVFLVSTTLSCNIYKNKDL
ncbi:ABC-2 transporter permease [Clostridium tyrobutyricum]|uniref:ABC-2 transporter permease n=1 Tax=Clostridium tyrobutyricum TaxID=1519 RepID=UPI001C38B594|nr:ABC-2 transporter permease [Clostridium tyrobutyricum]MBV4414961.1 ABC-2 transporter permease [Clostridium tyrobutyricum]MBV4421208.1 ABC-2 transporter permease [Clostridium tyrobutyricum]